MTENFRALIVILGLSIPAFLVLRQPLTLGAISLPDYKLRTGLWLALTFFLFVAHSFWLFTLGAALVLLILGQKDSNPLGLYAFLLLLAPPIQSAIEGFGGINRFLDLDWLRVLSLTVLLPTAIRLARQRESARLLKIPADKYLLAYLGLQLVIRAQVTSSTDLLRSVLLLFIDVFLPYYAFSRGLVDRRGMQDVFASFAAACTVLALIGVFEVLKGWLLYAPLPYFLDAYWGYGHYLGRDGALRATVSTGHPIVFGYVTTVALGLHMAVRPAYPNTASWLGVALVLGAGIAVSLSRGPWTGAVAMLASALAVAPRPAAQLGKLVVALVILVPVLMLTPYGSRIIDLLPFVGTVDAESVTYRQQLFDVAWDVVMMNPFFGSPYFLSSGALEQMRQGEGIIDIVNSYIGVALVTGLVGLSLFVLVFASSVRRLWVLLARHEDRTSPEHVMGRCLLATVVGVLVIIATASSINAIPVVYWCLAGACAACARSMRSASYGESSPSPQRKPGFRAASS